MAVTSLTEIGRKVTDSLDGRGIPVREHTIIYQALTSGAGTDGELVLAHPALPSLGDFYESPERVKNKACRCIAREPENQPDAPFRWVIPCKFSTQWPSVDPITANANPLLRPPVITRDLERQREVVTVDLLGSILATSADEPYDPPETRDANSRVITYEFNLPKFDEVEFDRDFLNCVNVTPWRGYPAFTVKIDGATSQSVTENGVTYDRVRLVLRVRFGKRIVKFGDPYPALIAAGGFKDVYRVVTEDPEPDGTVWSAWDALKLDQGYRVGRAGTSFAAGGATVHFVKDGVSTSKPVLLDGAGGPLERASWGHAGIPRYHLYSLYSAVKFEDLGLV